MGYGHGENTGRHGRAHWHRGRHLEADIHAMCTARRKCTARRQAAEPGNDSWNGPQPGSGVQAGNRLEKGKRVRVQGIRQKLGRFRAFDDASRVHDVEMVGVFSDHAQVVRNEQQRKMQALAHVAQQIENLALDRHVERGRWLVRDEKHGLCCDGQRNHRALAEPSAQLMRIGAGSAVRVRNANRVEQFEDSVLGRASARETVDRQCFLNLRANRVHRIEGNHGFLEHNTDLAPADQAHLFVVEIEKIPSVEEDTAGHDSSRRLNQLDNGQSRNRLSAAGLSDETECVAVGDRERHVVDGGDVAAVRQTKHRGEVFDTQEGGSHGSDGILERSRVRHGPITASVANCVGGASAPAGNTSLD